MKEQRTIIHLEMNGRHEYFGSPNSLYDMHSSIEIGISKAGLNNYFSQKSKEGKECLYINKKCTIRKGKIYVKPSTRGRKKSTNNTYQQYNSMM